MSESRDSNIFDGFAPPPADASQVSRMPHGALVDYALALQKECGLLDEENKLLAWESRTSLEYFSGAAKLAHRLNASTRDAIVHIALNEIAAFFGCSFAALFLYDGDSKSFKLARASRGADALSAYEREDAFLEKIFVSRPEAYIVDFDPETLCLVFEDGELFECAVPENWSGGVGERALIFPLRAQGAGRDAGLPLGGLILGDPENTLEGRDAEAAQFFADLLSSSLHNALLVEKLNALTIIDPLTNIYNRRHLLERLNAAMLLAGRQGHELCVAMIDIDHFKNFNDEYGHIYGDEVLREVARTLKAGIRTGVDLPARYGGEEFMIIMPFTDLAAAVEVSERLRRAVRKRRVRVDDRELGVTCSFGVARHIVGECVEKLIDRADIALYKAKNNGRDQVAAAPES